MEALLGDTTFAKPPLTYDKEITKKIRSLEADRLRFVDHDWEADSALATTTNEDDELDISAMPPEMQAMYAKMQEMQDAAQSQNHKDGDNRVDNKVNPDTETVERIEAQEEAMDSGSNTANADKADENDDQVEEKQENEPANVSESEQQVTENSARLDSDDESSVKHKTLSHEKQIRDDGVSEQ